MNRNLTLTLATLTLLSFTAFIFLRPSKPFFPRVDQKQEISASTLESIIQESDQALEKNSNDFKALVDKGVAHFHLGQIYEGKDYYDESFNELTEAWQNGAFDTRIFYYLGILSENLSVPGAEIQYQRFINHHPEDREIRLRLARVDFQLGKWEEAIQQYQKLLEENPQDLTSQVNLGLAHHSLYETESKKRRKDRLTKDEISSMRNEAIRQLELARNMNPALPQGVHYILAELYSDQEDWQKTAESAQAELQQYPEKKDVDIFRLLSQAQQKLGNDTELLQTYEDWVKIEPKNRSLKRRISKLKKKLGVS